jgi:hypothetical protein
MTCAAKGNAYPGYGGHVLPLEEETCVDALVRQHAPHPLATAPRDARESSALMQAVQFPVRRMTWETRREV